MLPTAAEEPYGALSSFLSVKLSHLVLSDAAGSGHSVCSEDSWTTVDEASAAVSGNQMWSMSFEWQDGQAEDTSEAIAQFEETTDFYEHSADPASEQSSSAELSSACLNDDAAEASPADAAWVQSWNQTDTAMTASSCHTHNDSASAHLSSTKQKPKSQPMSEEHKTAILGEDISSHASMLMTHACTAVCSSCSCDIAIAVPRCTKLHLPITSLSYVGAMKNVKIDYVPRWAIYMEETRWLNSIKAKAKVPLIALLLFF